MYLMTENILLYMNVLLRVTICDNLSEKKEKKKNTLVFELSVSYLSTRALQVPVAHILHVIIYIHLKLSRPK